MHLGHGPGYPRQLSKKVGGGRQGHRLLWALGLQMDPPVAHRSWVKFDSHHVTAIHTLSYTDVLYHVGYVMPPLGASAKPMGKESWSGCSGQDTTINPSVIVRL